MSAAVVPVKALAASKSRLLSAVSREELEALAIAMLEDVLAALLATPALDRVAVATPDARVAAAARRAGALALHGPDGGLNAAIDASPGKLGLAPDEPYLVVLGDVAGAQPAELQQLFEVLAEQQQARPGQPAAVLAPSRDGGTSALLRAPATAIASRFGPKSAARHREAAAEVGVPLRELALASLAIDLDQAEDVDRFLASEGGGKRTRELLLGLGWATRA